MMKQSPTLMIPLLAWMVFGFAINAQAVAANSCSQTDVQAAVNSAARGGTVTVPAGSCTWSSTLSLTKGITLVGPGRDSLTITSSCTSDCSTYFIQILPDSMAISNNETIRVSGFTFDGNNSLLAFIKGDMSGTTPLQKLIIDNNRFKNASMTLGNNGTIYTNGQFRGVIYSNIFDRIEVPTKIMGNDTFDPEWRVLGPSMAFGSGDNLFFEDNTIQWSSALSGGDPGWTEEGQSGRLVMRYNTFNYANVQWDTGGDTWDIHGSQYNPNGETSSLVSEYYGNTLTNNPKWRWAIFRGGWGLFFDNVDTGTGSVYMQVANYSGSCDSTTGYPTTIRNTYFWNNTGNGTEEAAAVNQDACGTLIENSAYWNYNASCTASSCTAGIGRGTAAPTGTCTTGVGYWVSSTPTATTSSSVIQSAKFYKCVSTNNWQLYYQPYTYPHPLRVGSSSSIAPPGNLSATVQ
jgi:hypothetical protein